MKTQDRPEGRSSGRLDGQNPNKPPKRPVKAPDGRIVYVPADYYDPFFGQPGRGIDPCRKCKERPPYLARHRRTGRLTSFEASGMPHRAVCRRTSKAAARWQAEHESGP